MGPTLQPSIFLRQTVLETCEDTFCKMEKLPREPGAEQLIGHLEVHVAVCIDCSRASLHLGKDSIHKVQCQDRRHLETTHKQVSLAPLLREGQNPQKVCVPVNLLDLLQVCSSSAQYCEMDLMKLKEHKVAL